MAKRINPKIMEKIFAELDRVLEGKEFSTGEELKEFINKYIKERKFKKIKPRNSLEQAQDLVYQAWEEENRKKRIRLAEKALKISKDCADAYVILAEEKARTLEEAKKLYEEAVKAGRRALGEKTFKEDKGHFWGVIKTRPFMRAMDGLASCLWEKGNFNMAASLYKEMLELNPNDNQGVRYQLAILYAEAGWYEELRKFLFSSNYKDDTDIIWLYAKALLLFKEKGDGPEASFWLWRALKRNPYVIDYLTGRKKLPSKLPEAIALGGEDEAEALVHNFFKAFQKVEGFLKWVIEEAIEGISPRIGRNDPCPCGSGKKYKKCCGE